MQYLRGTYLPFHKIHCQVALRIKIVCNSFIGRIMKITTRHRHHFFFISLGNFHDDDDDGNNNIKIVG